MKIKELNKCFIPEIKITDNLINDDFLNCIVNNPNNNKVNTIIEDKKSKIVNDELTKITNNLLTTKKDCTINLFYAIYTIFGEIDNDNLKPYINGQSKNMNDYDTNMYFVFKGGNTIKYWINKTYLDKMEKNTKNLEDILSNKIEIYENDYINAYSDFDFCLYIDFKFINEEEYNNILRKIGEKIFLLRNDIKNIFNDESLEYFNNEKINIDLLDKLKIYINLNNPNNPNNIKFKFPEQSDDFILTRNNKNVKYIRKVNEKLIISFNNLIQFNTSDFDLFRIKLGIVATYNNDNDNDNMHNFNSEVFDLSILRKTDTKLEKFTENITDYTKIINLKKNNKIIQVRLYNNKYILIDLLGILFTNVPWLDTKYEKRLIRFAFSTSLYNQEIFDAYLPNLDNIKNIELNIGIFNILNILSIIDIYNTLDNLYDNIFIFKNIINKNLNIIINSKELLISLDMIDFITTINNIINGGAGDTGDTDSKYDNLKNYDKYKSYPNKFFCLIILVFIRKILIESDYEWYKIIINDKADLDYFEIKHLLIKFLKTYMYYFLVSTFSLTNVKTLFDIFLKDNFSFSKLSLNLDGGFRGFRGSQDLKYNPTYKLNQKSESTYTSDQKLESTYKLIRLTFKQIELNRKIKEINNKLKDSLLKLYKINYYFKDEEHEYLLNSNMEPEIIRKIKDENKIEEVFNILKDILQLK
jgi:hypothetical protein